MYFILLHMAIKESIHDQYRLNTMRYSTSIQSRLQQHVALTLIYSVDSGRQSEIRWVFCHITIARNIFNIMISRNYTYPKRKHCLITVKVYIAKNILNLRLSQAKCTKTQYTLWSFSKHNIYTFWFHSVN